jgi:hypothetical protein
MDFQFRMARELGMRFITIVCAQLLLVAMVSPAPAQSAKAKKQIQSHNKKAMESYDQLEFEAAKAALDKALLAAEKGGLEEDPLVARVLINLGIVEFAGLNDEAAAREAFAAAVAIDPAIDVDVAYRTEAMSKLLAEVKRSAKEDARLFGEESTGATGPDASCAELEGIDHSLISKGKPGRAQTIEIRVGESLGAERVSLFYREAGAEEFEELRMKRTEDCSYAATIPARAMRGESVHYYVSALAGKKTLASRGSSGSPNIIELGGARRGGDEDNPLGEEDTRSGGRDKPTVFVSAALGTGGGYVTGKTEVIASDVSCCVASALLHLFPEVGYYFTRQMSLSAAFRMGFAVGANVEGHATAAPAGLLRVRYALAESGAGLHVSGAVGGGIIRNTVKVEQAIEGMDTDTTAAGPFLLGAGVGFAQPVSEMVRLVGELNSIAAIPGGIKELGPCPGSGCVRPHFGLQFDLNLGVLLAF